MSDETEKPVEKRRRGRQKGLGKVPGSGRQKGAPNRANLITRDFIISEGMPIHLLAKVARGRRILAAVEPGSSKRVKVYPTVDQQMRAAEILAKKVVPDLRAQELTGKDGGAVAMTLIDFLKALPA